MHEQRAPGKSWLSCFSSEHIIAFHETILNSLVGHLAIEPPDQRQEAYKKIQDRRIHQLYAK